MKIVLFFCLLVFSTVKMDAQYLFMKMVGETKGIPLAGAMGKSTTLAYAKKGMTKTETTVMGTTQTEIVEPDKVTVMHPDLCGVFTKEELLTDGLNDDVEYKDVVVTKTEETKKLLGYLCTKTLIKYTIVRSGEYDYECTIWTTDGITGPDNKDLPQSSKPNPFFDAMKNLGGVPLLTETLMKATGVRTIVTVTEVDTKEPQAPVFGVNPKLCKEPKNLADFKKEVKRRQNRAQRY